MSMNKQRKVLAKILMPVVVAVISACGTGLSDSPPVPTRVSLYESAIRNSRIVLPSSFTGATAPEYSFRSPGPEPVTPDQLIADIYEGVRETLNTVSQFSDFAFMLVMNSSRLLAWSASGEWENDLTSEGEVTKIVWNPSDGEYETEVRFYFGEDVGLRIYLTVNASAGWARGIIDWDAAITAHETGAGRMRIVFDGNEKTMTVLATGFNPADAAEFNTARIDISSDSSGYIQLYGAYHVPEAHIYEDSAPESRCYLFTVAGYSQMAVPSVANKAVIKLAIPPGDLDSVEDLFDSYSVGGVFLDKISEALKQTWIDESMTVAAIETWMGVDDFEGTTIAELTDNDIIRILEWAAANTADGNAAELQSMIFVLNLVNPAYFSSTSFVGTYNGLRGTLSSIPSGFTAINADVPLAATPLEVKDLILEDIE